MKRVIGIRLGLLAVIMLPLVLIFSIPASESGTRWLCTQAQKRITGLSIGKVEGTLLGRLSLEAVNFEDDTQRLSLGSVRLAWQPQALLAGRLHIETLALDAISITLPKPSQTESASTFDFSQLAVPVAIRVDDLKITRLAFTNSEQTFVINQVELAASLRGNNLELTRLATDAYHVKTTVQGQIGLTQNLPLNINAGWQAALPTGEHWQGNLRAQGDLLKLIINSQTTGTFDAQLDGVLENLTGQPRFAVTGGWQNLQWPLAGEQAQFKSGQGRFTLNGSIDAYTITLGAQLNPPYLKQAELSLTAQGSTQAIKLAPLALTSADGNLQIGGDIGWQNGIQFDVNVAGEHFNPGVLYAPLPGQINLDSHLQGSWNNGALALAVDLKRLDGKLKTVAFDGSGRFQLAGNQLKLDSFNLNAGANRLSANGSLGQEQGELALSLKLPALKTLWPSLSGSLNGEGSLKGAWQNPAVEFKAQGKNLSVPPYRSGRLELAVDYHPEPSATSTLGLSVGDIRDASGPLAQSVTLDASGNPGNHKADLALHSQALNLDLTLAGQYRNAGWQGQLSRLQLANPHVGKWQLAGPVAVKLIPQTAGIDAVFSEACLVQAQAHWCGSGRYLAGGSFDLTTTANDLPTALLQPYLPPQMQLNGKINLTAAIHKQRGILNGHYRIDMPEAAVLTMPPPSNDKLPIQLAELAGTLERNTVQGRLDLSLPAGDFARAKLSLALDKQQTIAGSVLANVHNFRLLNAFVPQLSELSGLFKADLTVSGTLQKPGWQGNLSLVNTQAKVPDLGLELRDVNLIAYAPADAGSPMRIFGSAKSGAGLVKLEGMLTLDPELEWPLQLALTGNDFEISKRTDAQIAVSPDLKLMFSPNKGLVSGRLAIPKALISLKKLPDNAIAVSADERIVGETQAQPKGFASGGIDAAIAITLGQNVHFSGQGLEAQLTGNLRLNQNRSKTEVTGSVEMVKATYKSYGQDLTVRKGHLIFNGPIDNPWLDVEAIRVSKDQKTTAILSVSGALSAPQTKISADPALPETEALAYLVTGQSLDQAGQSDSSALAGAALAYGVGQASWLTDKLGVDTFELQQGATLQKSLLNIGQHLNKDFYVGAKVGLFAKQSVLVIKQKLTQIFSIETQAGFSQRIKLNAEFDSD
ncbi:MAG: hypothetical protein CTY29_10015 [Methylobacter sp.]|nr:MAG: hypothetical protein CTY29_10015 [Methylobacter sp.]